MATINLYLLIICVTLNSSYGWDSDQLEVFDVVEEVKVNFYELLNVSQDANSSVIRSEFRKLTLKLHPDKNKEEDTSEQFRNLVSVHDILKDEKKRKYYDEVLANGLPNWRSAVYYYRHVRKMGLVEMSLILFFILTIGQYLVSWASYFEKRYNAEQAKTKKQKEMAKLYIANLPKPTIYDTLPFQLPLFIYRLVISIPWLIMYFKSKAVEKVEEVLHKEEEDEVEEVVEKKKTVRRRKPGFVPPEGSTVQTTGTNNDNNSSSDTLATPPPLVTGGLWTDDDLLDLIKLVKKYPGGTPERWERIAEALGRAVPEVTYMANKMKNNSYKMPTQVEEEVVDQPKVKEKTRGGKLGIVNADVPVSNWDQHQQKALEDALLSYPKGATDRWDRIADCVPEKTKDECILRYKYLVDAIKKKHDPKEQE